MRDAATSDICATRPRKSFLESAGRWFTMGSHETRSRRGAMSMQAVMRRVVVWAIAACRNGDANNP